MFIGLIQEKSAMKIARRCNISFAINVDYDNELDCEVAPIDACEVIFGNPY
jgi:hypothetical protein